MSFRRPPRALPDRLAADQSEARRSRAYRTAGPVSFDNTALVARGIQSIASVSGTIANPAPLWGYYDVMRATFTAEADRYYSIRGHVNCVASAVGRHDILVVYGYDPASGSFTARLDEAPTYYGSGSSQYTSFDSTHVFPVGTFEVAVLLVNALTLLNAGGLFWSAQVKILDEGAA